MSEFHIGTRLEPTPICVMYPSGPVWQLKSTGDADAREVIAGYKAHWPTPAVSARTSTNCASRESIPP